MLTEEEVTEQALEEVHDPAILDTARALLVLMENTDD